VQKQKCPPQHKKMAWVASFFRGYSFFSSVMQPAKILRNNRIEMAFIFFPENHKEEFYLLMIN
jgi:hypothetical protein